MDASTPVTAEVTWTTAVVPGQREALLALLFGPLPTACADEKAGAA